MRSRLLLALALVASAATPGTAGESPTLLACRAIADGPQRLRCYDAAVDALLPGPPPAHEAPSVSASADAPVPPPASVVSGETLFGKVDSTETEVIQKAFGVPNIDSIESTVAEVRRTPDARFLFVLANSQVWLQTDNSTLQVRVGDAVKIRRGAVGSYWLATGTAKKGMRVKRVS